MGRAREPCGTQDKGLPFVLVQRALPNKYREIGLYHIIWAQSDVFCSFIKSRV